MSDTPNNENALSSANKYFKSLDLPSLERWKKSYEKAIDIENGKSTAVKIPARFGITRCYWMVPHWIKGLELVSREIEEREVTNG